MAQADHHVFLAGDALRVGRAAACLVGTICDDCGAKAFPPAEVCCECMSERMSELELSTRGNLYAFSVVHVAPAGWKVPYIAGYVDLPEGVRVFGHVVNADPERLRMDTPVALTTAVLGCDEAGLSIESYAFEPA